MERWRDITGYEGLYQVSDQGRVRSLDRVNGRGFHVSGVILRQNPDRKGYLGVSLYSGSKESRRRRLVHQLVAEEFIGTRPKGLDVCHNDVDKKNNSASNLRYDTRSNNILDAVKHGTHIMARQTECKRGHRLGAFDGDRSQGCRACARAKATISYHEDLAPYEDRISDIHYENMTGTNKRLLRSDILDMLNY
ncbi:HNH endonuclease [Corynebacterium phage Darwin]|uniref:HNH endonuclease n=1 Tax=Corynebacterium phage Darwin TaxID=2047869 RepID=A0A2H4P8L9_9CAUD|nr:HNH endonuclease [Corynebacterium phage Darwin]ATW58573.1 HNH endonuclease [Corynebacterium phage Darwin]